MTGFEVLLRDIRCSDESCAGAVHIKSRCVDCADLFLDKACCGGIEEVRSAGGNQDEVYIFGLNAGVLKRFLRCLHAHVVSGLVGEDMTLLYAGARCDPLVRSIEELREFVVVCNKLRDISARSQNLNSAH